jgi:hypothetical protein
MCAAKNVKLAGGSVRGEFKTVDVFKEHHGAQAGTATALRTRAGRSPASSPTRWRRQLKT